MSTESSIGWTVGGYPYSQLKVIAVDVLLRPLHGDPRWQPFLQRLRLA